MTSDPAITDPTLAPPDQTGFDPFGATYQAAL